MICTLLLNLLEIFTGDNYKTILFQKQVKRDLDTSQKSKIMMPLLLW